MILLGVKDYESKIISSLYHTIAALTKQKYYTLEYRCVLSLQCNHKISVWF